VTNLYPFQFSGHSYVGTSRQIRTLAKAHRIDVSQPNTFRALGDQTLIPAVRPRDAAAPTPLISALPGGLRADLCPTSPPGMLHDCFNASMLVATPPRIPRRASVWVHNPRRGAGEHPQTGTTTRAQAQLAAPDRNFVDMPIHQSWRIELGLRWHERLQRLEHRRKLDGVVNPRQPVAERRDDRVPACSRAPSR
jgi:hypothetical protein